MPTDLGTLYLARASQVALWTHELTGQISDGMWENAAPWEHYKFWCHLKVELLPARGAPCVETAYPYLCTREAYGFSSLYGVKDDDGNLVILDRMVKLGRLALACELAGHACGYEQRVASEDMPATYEAYQELTFAELGMPDDPRLRFLAAVPHTLATAYYNHPACVAYGVKQVKDDVKAIKAAMKDRRSPAR
jgi:hypothetical protein